MSCTLDRWGASARHGPSHANPDPRHDHPQAHAVLGQPWAAEEPQVLRFGTTVQYPGWHALADRVLLRMQGVDHSRVYETLMIMNTSLTWPPILE